MDPPTVEVRSMYYIYSNEDRTVVKVMRFLKNREVKPYRAFLLNEGYEIPFADALVVKKEILLSQPKVEEENRKEFIQEISALLLARFQFQEQERILEEAKTSRGNAQREHLMQEKIDTGAGTEKAVIAANARTKEPNQQSGCHKSKLR